jgi:hypothetical protein
VAPQHLLADGLSRQQVCCIHTVAVCC